MVWFYTFELQVAVRCAINGRKCRQYEKQNTDIYIDPNALRFDNFGRASFGSCVDCGGLIGQKY